MRYGPVSIDPDVMSGTPVFAGTRVPIRKFFNYIEGAYGLEEFPSVTKEAAIAVLEMAKNTLTFELLLHADFV